MSLKRPLDADEPPAKKYRTRSSTNTQQPTENTPDAAVVPSKTPSSPHKQRKSKSKSKSASKTSPEAHISNVISKDSATSFSINTPSLKTPISCQTYTPSNSSGTSKDQPSSYKDTLIFTHGAGGTLSAPAFVHFCNGFSNTSPSSLPILAFQGSMNLASRVKGFHACIDHIVKQDQDEASQATKTEGTEHGNQRENRLLLGGRSMGSRAAVIAATEYLSAPSNLSLPKSSESSIDLILVSYPLINGNKPMRDQILIDLPAHVRVLFIIGSEDKMCPLKQLTTVRESMQAHSWMIVVEGLDHGMRGKRERELGEWAGRAAAEWVAGDREEMWEYPRVLRAEDLEGDEG